MVWIKNATGKEKSKAGFLNFFGSGFRIERRLGFGCDISDTLWDPCLNERKIRRHIRRLNPAE